MTQAIDIAELERQLELLDAGRPFDRSPDEIGRLADRILKSRPNDNDALYIKSILGPASRSHSRRRPILTILADTFSPSLLRGLGDGAGVPPRIRAFGRLTPQAVAGVVIAAICADLLLMGAKHAWVAHLWLATLLSVIAVRSVYAVKLLRSVRKGVAEQRQLAGVRRMAAIIGSLWGGLLLALPSLGASDALVPVLLVTLAVMAGSITAYSVVPRAAPIYSVLVGVPAAYAAFGHSPSLGALGIVFVLWNTLSAFSHERLYTESLEQNRELLHEREKLETVLQSGPNGAVTILWETDGELRIRNVDERLAAACGCGPRELEGHEFTTLFGLHEIQSGDRGSSGALTASVMLRQAFRGLEITTHDGRVLRRWEFSGSPRYDHARKFIGYRGLCRDVTDLRAPPEALPLWTDDLTGLPPLWWMRPRIDDALVQARHGKSLCAVGVLALDGFDGLQRRDKVEGSRVLQAVAARLRAAAGRFEVAYLNGGKFLLFCDDFLKIAQVTTEAAGLAGDLEGLAGSAKTAAPLKPVVGLSLAPLGPSSTALLIEQAETAVAAAREGGRPVEVYRRPERRAPVSVDQLRSALVRAIDQDLVVARYSLVCDAVTRTPAALSLKLRWEHQTFGLIDGDVLTDLIADPITATRLSDHVLNRVLPEAVSVANGLKVMLPAGVLDVSNPMIWNRLVAYQCAGVSHATRLGVIVDGERLTPDLVEKLLEMVSAGVELGLRAADVSSLDGRLVHRAGSVWIAHDNAEATSDIARGRDRFGALRSIVAEGLDDASLIASITGQGFTSFAGLAPMTDISASEVTAFTRRQTPRSDQALAS